MARAEIGVYIPQVSVTFEQLLARALLCEQLGYDSFWVYDHLYAPNLPGNDALEGWTLATALLARTTRLRLEEALEIITRMFTSERTTFDGRWYQVRDLPNLPQPVQQPRPPIHVGGIGERYTLPLVARFADVWNVPTYGLGVWREREAALDTACEAIGRDAATIRRSLEAVLVVTADEHALVEARARAVRRYAGPGWGLAEGGFVGTPPAIVDRIAELMDQGMSLFVFFLADRGERDMLHLLAEEVIPHLPR